MGDSNTGDEEKTANYDFNANKGAPLLFAAIFGISLLVHSFQAIHYRTFWVWPLILGLMLEVLGWTTRWYSIEKLYTVWPAIVTQVAVIVAPAFIAAQNYMLVGRLMSYLGAQYSPMSHVFITKVFVIADFISIFSQAGGGGMLGSTDLNTLKIGFDVLIGALAFQVVMFILFVFITIIFDIRSRRGVGEARKPLQPLFNAFYVSAAMIILRSIFRLIEFATVKFTPEGAFGYTLNHEWLLYVWDALPITVSVYTLSIIHAGKYLPRQKGLRIDGTVEDPAPSRVCGCCCIYKRPRPSSKRTYEYAFTAQAAYTNEDHHELALRHRGGAMSEGYNRA